MEKKVKKQTKAQGKKAALRCPQKALNKIFLKIVAKGFLVYILMLYVFYLLLPTALNYPVNSIDNEFQQKVVGIGYTQQYVLFSIIQLIILFIFFLVTYLSVRITGKETKKQLEVIRERCFNLPYIILLTISFVPATISTTLLILFKTDWYLTINLAVLVMAFSSIAGTITYILFKEFFQTIIKMTMNITDNKATGHRSSVSTRILQQMIPVFIASTTLFVIIANFIICNEKGEVVYKAYRRELQKELPADKTFTMPQVIEIMNHFTYIEPSDKLVIVSATNLDDVKVGNLNTFAKEYLKRYYTKEKGHIYTEYGKSVQAVFTKVHTTEGDYYVGIEYRSIETITLVWIILIILVLIFLDIAYTWYTASALQKDISKVTNGMKSILKQKDHTTLNTLPVLTNDETGDLVTQFNNLQNNNNVQIERINSSQEIILEQERLASLGQMIGGIAHNLKTPIFSISGATKALEDLVQEYDMSIEVDQVTNEDMHEIAKEMSDWVEKIKTHTSYMSDVITAVKGQAVVFNEAQEVPFTVSELFKNVNTLMSHELKKALVTLQIDNQVDDSVIIHGSLNSLIQILNNIVSNAIDSYNGRTGTIELFAMLEGEYVKISVQDYGQGMKEDVKDKAFKEMITTKGKKGTGLGLYMCNTTIKGQFKGNIELESEYGKGTKITLYIPYTKQ